MAVNVDVGVSKYVVFRIEEEEYGADIQKVTTIERVLSITKIPKTHHYVKGVINLRGEIIPVLDLRSRLGFQEVDNTDETRTIVIRLGELVVGFIVDAVSEVLEIRNDCIESSESFNSSISSNFVLGVGKSNERILTLLNFEEIAKLN